jgi:diguanylate cyclase (GGDEF)-like protein
LDAVGRSTTRKKKSSHGAIPTALVVGASAALGAGIATSQIGTPAASAAAAGIAAAVIGLVASHRFVIASCKAREATANRLVLETQKELREEKADRAARRELDHALDQAEDEEAALVVVRHALSRHFENRPIEVHLVHPVEPVLRVEIALCRPAETVGFKSSPWEPLATRNGATLVYDTTDRVDACPHLRDRAGKPSSAVAVPLIATGRILGLIYAFGPDGESPDQSEVVLLEEFASAIAARLAVTRSYSRADTADTIDRLTGLPDRAAMQHKVIGLLTERIPFSVAIADIDNFSALNDEYGRQAGDAALSLLGGIARQAIRPDDIVGRVGGDELLFVMPHTSPADTTRAIERVREELFVTQAAADGGPRFTMSVGIVGSAGGLTIDAILKTVATALRAARDAGGNRIVVGEPVRQPT